MPLKFLRSAPTNFRKLLLNLILHPQFCITNPAPVSYISGFVMVKFVQEEKKEKMRVMEMVAHHLYVNQKKAIGMSLV